MSSDAQTLRQLTIKTNVIKRLSKERDTDYKEVEERKIKLQELKDGGADGADIRNAERVVKDAEQMIPRTKTSLDRAIEDLEDLVNALSTDAEIKGSTEWQTASNLLQQIDNEATKQANGH